MIKNQLTSINPKNNKLSSWDIHSLNDINIIIKKTAHAQIKLVRNRFDIKA